MKTGLSLLAAIVLPGGFIVLGVAVIGYVLARHRKTPEFSGVSASAR